MSIQTIINGLSLGGVYATIAVGFALIFNILKFSNFSHSGVLVSTAYIGYFITTKLHTNFWMTLLLTAVAGGCLAVCIEFIGFRRLRKNNAPIMLYFVSSITIGMLLENLMTVLFSSSYYSYPMFFKTMSFEVGDVMFVVTDILMLLISCIALALIMFVLYKTRLGVAIRALSMDSKTTSLMGMNVTLIIVATFFVSGMMGGISGMFLGINYTLYPQLGKLVVKGFIASVLGGLGNISGAVMGAFLLGLMEVFLINIDFIGSSYAPVVIFVVMIVFLLVRPQGIAGKIVREKA
ncbi:branched-chain amino acid ABC transporter permease [Oscillospiraceae bacterium PP1C4]